MEKWPFPHASYIYHITNKVLVVVFMITKSDLQGPLINDHNVNEHLTISRYFLSHKNNFSIASKQCQIALQWNNHLCFHHANGWLIRSFYSYAVDKQNNRMKSNSPKVTDLFRLQKCQTTRTKNVHGLV